jgi:crotonobetainyl-CoA:carnitine CoA-transferase CaiB-like acyl-CoA transferase
VEPLNGYTVVDLSTGIAGAYCTKLLADGGAEVVKVEAPEGDPLRRWSASGTGIPPGEDGALFSFLACSKHSVIAEPETDIDFINALLTDADAVVWSRGSILTPAAILSAHPHLTVTAITPFGLEGPWKDRPATEFTLQAWSGGIVGLGRGSADRAPVFVGGQVGDYLAGAYAGAATMASRMRGAAELIDLSMLEAQILGLTYYPVSYFKMLGRPWRDARRLTVPGIARAKDGLIDIGCGTAQQWFDLCAMTGHQDWIDEESPLSITEQANEKSAELYAWVQSQTVEEIRDLATAFRIPNAPVANGANVESLDHFQARGSFVSNPRDGFSQPGPPYRLQPARLRAPQPAPRLGEHTDHYRRNRIPGRKNSESATRNSISPFEGLRVLDMTTFWAGPSCTHMLAMLGAEVIHVESTRRPDGTRLIAGIPITEDQWWEKSPIFSGLNTNKKGLTLDLQSAAGRELLMRLIATCDVIVENFTPRVLDQIGLDFAAVQAVRPDAIMLRMPGFGLDGPWRDNPAFAYVIEAASGISWLTGYPDRNPYEPYSVGDPNAGVHAFNALLLALEHRRQTGQGVHIEAAMVDAALNVAAEQVIEYSAYGALLQRDGNRGPTAAPQNLYRTNEIDEFGRRDCWVAIAVATDEQWQGLCVALEQPDWMTEYSEAAARRAHHDLIDECLSAWCEERTGDDIVEALWSRGVPVAKVMQPHRQSELPQLAARGFFEDVEHPVNPRTPHSTLPFTSSRGPEKIHVQPAPLLGQHNHEVLSELGLSAKDIDDLEAQGVIGAAPAMHAGSKAVR